MIIEEYHFGSMTIDGITYRTDIRISPSGKIMPEWWREKGHRVEIEDVLDIIDDDLEILVLGKGKPGFMKSSKALKKYLMEKNITLIEEASSKAVQRVNRFVKNGNKFAAGFHLTC